MAHEIDCDNCKGSEIDICGHGITCETHGHDWQHTYGTPVPFCGACGYDPTVDGKEPPKGPYQAVKARSWPPEDLDDCERIGRPERTLVLAMRVAEAEVSHLSRCFFGVRCPDGTFVEMSSEQHEKAKNDDRDAAYNPGRVVWG